MPTLETVDGKPVEVDAAEINARFDAANSGASTEDPAALPKRAARGPATDTAKPRTVRQPKAEKSRTTSKPAATTLSRDARVRGLQGIGQVAAALFAGAGQATGSKALLADSLAIAGTTEDGAEAFASVADSDPQFAAVIDKICAAGPWSAVIGWGLGLGCQLLRNHRPGLALPGTAHPDDLLLLAQAAPAAA